MSIIIYKNLDKYHILFGNYLKIKAYYIWAITYDRDQNGYHANPSRSPVKQMLVIYYIFISRPAQHTICQLLQDKNSNQLLGFTTNCCCHTYSNPSLSFPFSQPPLLPYPPYKNKLQILCYPSLSTWLEIILKITKYRFRSSEMKPSF